MSTYAFNLTPPPRLADVLPPKLLAALAAAPNDPNRPKGKK